MQQSSGSVSVSVHGQKVVQSKKWPMVLQVVWTIALDPRCITMIHSEQSVAVETLASSSCIRCLLIHRVSIPYHIFIHHSMSYPFRITNRRFKLLKLTCQAHRQETAPPTLQNYHCIENRLVGYLMSMRLASSTTPRQTPCDPCPHNHIRV